jgi:crotonobetainyl-CoA:carnitine CoA-transferase CaiB-like acyl-CoA transferase
MILGDMGAEIIKVEKVGDGDDQRKLGPFINGESCPFMMINRNKKSLTLNLKTTEGMQLFLDIARNVDVVIENFRPGTVHSLGIDYDAVKQINPGVIYCSISGYGQTGPDSRKGGFDIMAQAATGMMDLNSHPGERPSKTPLSFHDATAGLVALYAILGAYIQRLKSGDGQFIDVSLVESGLALATQEVSAYFGSHRVPKVMGTRNHMSAPYQAYRCKGGFIVVGAGNQRLWERFCNDVIEKPAFLTDPRFATMADRVAHMDDLEVALEEVFAAEERGFWVEKMDKAGVPGGPINSLDQALEDPQILARDMVCEIEHPIAGKIKTLGIPAKLSGTPSSLRMPAPILGEHTAAVLLETLNLSDEQIAALKMAGAI